MILNTKTKLELVVELSNRFHAGFNFITAANVPKPSWKTNRKYKLTRGEWIKLYSDELTLLGVGFDGSTKYCMLDIDRGSKYHPYNDLQAFKKVCQTLEKVGLVSYDNIRSSHSEGIHVYFHFPYAVNTFRLAALIHVTLINAGIDLRDGQIEQFPNPKAYGTKEHPTYYKPHRLPLQPNAGGLLLDRDGDILLTAENLTHESTIAGFLRRAKASAAAQDMQLLERKLNWAYNKYKTEIGKYQYYHQKDYSHIAREWKENLEFTLEIGWTDYHQTNTLLPNYIQYGVVFLGLKGEMLAEWIYDKIIITKGYREYCRHQREIKKVIRGWVDNTERQGYYVEYCGFPARSGLSPYKVIKYIKSQRNEHNENLAKRTEQRLNAILAALTEIPERVGAKIAAIRSKSLELFGEAISRNTLYKPEYKSLWFKAAIARCELNLAENPTPPSDRTLTVVPSELQAINGHKKYESLAAQTQSQTNLSYTPSLYEICVRRSCNAGLHHQLQLHCINLLCQSILDLQSLEQELESDRSRSYLEFTSALPDPQSLPTQNICNTKKFRDNPLIEGIAEIRNDREDGEFEISNENSLKLETQIDIESSSDLVPSIEIGTMLRRNVQQIGRKTYPALANCQVVSANGLDWVVRDREGYSWNVSHHALESEIWEIESDLAVVADLDVRSVVEIARQVRINIAAIPDELLLEFLHHPDLDAIQETIELADEVAAARSRQQIEALVANLSHCQKLELWQVLSVQERDTVERQIKVLPNTASPSSSDVQDRFTRGTIVTTLTGLVGTIRHVFKSVAKPFVVYHEELNRTICYQDSELRFITE